MRLTCYPLGHGAMGNALKNFYVFKDQSWYALSNHEKAKAILNINVPAGVHGSNSSVAIVKKMAFWYVWF